MNCVQYGGQTTATDMEGMVVDEQTGELRLREESEDRGRQSDSRGSALDETMFADRGEVSRMIVNAERRNNDLGHEWRRGGQRFCACRRHGLLAAAQCVPQLSRKRSIHQQQCKWQWQRECRQETQTGWLAQWANCTQQTAQDGFRPVCGEGRGNEWGWLDAELQTGDAEGQIGAESTGIGSSRNGDVICKARNKVTCSVRNSLNALNDFWWMGCLQLCGISVSNTARQRHVYICHVKKSDMYKWVEE